MLIINADDWGRLPAETDAALRCHKHGRITSVSAMVFMADSERAALLAREHKVDAGLHLNFSEQFTADCQSVHLKESHRRVAAFLARNRYSQLLYNPLLRKDFAYCCAAQFEEFFRLFGAAPSHVDGHHHMHLCANVLWSGLVPPGMKTRRNFSFWPGEKSLLNRAYRSLIDYLLGRRYKLTDYFFDLTQCIKENKFGRVKALAKSGSVELMTHPVSNSEMRYLMSDELVELLDGIEARSYRDLSADHSSKVVNRVLHATSTEVPVRLNGQMNSPVLK